MKKNALAALVAEQVDNSKELMKGLVEGPQFEAFDFDTFDLDAAESIDTTVVDDQQFGFEPEKVIGKDDRQRVGNTTTMPYMAITKVFIKAGNNRNYIGTGYLTASNKLYTAGHVVYNAKTGGWAKAIAVVPGMNGSKRPYGAYSAVGSISTNGWVQRGIPRYDMGAIKLSHGVSHGQFIKPQLNDVSTGTVTGYPGDRDNGIHQYTHTAPMSKKDGMFRYAIDTFGGQSGSPVLASRTHAVGIHNYGGRLNSGSDLYKEFIEFVNRW